MPEKLFSVRPYRAEDRDKVRSLCCDTGYFGQPVENVFQDREWFADFNTNYYLKYEPDSCFVAEADNKIIGYILGSKHLWKYRLIFYPLIASPLILKALIKYLSRAYDKKSKSHIKRLVLRGGRERPKRPKRAAHLHFNVEKGYRNKGIGKALIRTLLKHFLENDVERVYGEVIHTDQLRDESFYTSHGFKILDKKLTTLAGEEFGKTYLMCVEANLKNIKDIFNL